MRSRPARAGGVMAVSGAFLQVGRAALQGVGLDSECRGRRSWRAIAYAAEVWRALVNASAHAQRPYGEAKSTACHTGTDREGQHAGAQTSAMQQDKVRSDDATNTKHRERGTAAGNGE